MIKQVVLASKNKGKVSEIGEILKAIDIKVVSMEDVGFNEEIEETGNTFYENALIKAKTIYQKLKCPVLADDSGLEVFALNGEPGVYSARYAGDGGNDGRNLAKLLAKMEGISDRSARFVCVMAVATPEGIVGTAEGEVRGKIALAAAGQGGFGYDPAFIPNGFDRTFGELPQEVKNSLSHRSNALKAAIAKGLL